jgi:hypothetical protein
MTRLGIDLGATWSIPLVALIDKQGRVVWQAQDVSALGPLHAILRQRILVPQDKPSQPD